MILQFVILQFVILQFVGCCHLALTMGMPHVGVACGARLSPPQGPIAANSPPSSSTDDSKREALLIRLRRGDSPRSPIQEAESVVAIPRQISRGDLSYWCWLLGGNAFDVSRLEAPLLQASKEDDALRLSKLPALFETAKAAARDVGNRSATELKSIAVSLGKLRTNFIDEMQAKELVFFQSIEELSEGAIEAADLVALRLIDIDECYPESVLAARINVGRLVYAHARSGEFDIDSARIASLTLREELAIMSEPRRLHVRNTSDLISDGNEIAQLAQLSARGGSVAADSIHASALQHRRTQRRFAALAGRIAEQNSVLIDDITAALPPRAGELLRADFARLAYGSLATPPFDTQPLLDAAGQLGDPSSTDLIVQSARDFNVAAELRQREVHRHFAAYERKILATSVRDEEEWRRTANLVTAIHAESDRSLQRIASTLLAATEAESSAAMQAVIDEVFAQGRRRVGDQIDGLDGYFSTTRITPTREQENRPAVAPTSDSVKTQS